MAKDDEPKKGIIDYSKDRMHIAKDSIYKAKGKTEDYIRENPLAAVAIAALIGAGVALGVNYVVEKQRKKHNKSLYRKVKRLFR